MVESGLGLCNEPHKADDLKRSSINCLHVHSQYHLRGQLGSSADLGPAQLNVIELAPAFVVSSPGGGDVGVDMCVSASDWFRMA